MSLKVRMVASSSLIQIVDTILKLEQAWPCSPVCTEEQPPRMAHWHHSFCTFSPHADSCPSLHLFPFQFQLMVVFYFP